VPDIRWTALDKPIWETRGAYVEHLWTISRSMADCKMGNTISLEQWMAELRSSGAAG
jgi:hypothetical protein